MQPDELNEMFSVPGRLSFSEPTTMEIARDLHDHHRAQARREDIIRRSDGGFGSGGLARFGIGVAATLTDPLNIASAFIPFLGEARVASVLGQSAVGLGGRLAVRAAEGAGQGSLGAAALEPLNYWLSQQDRDDYTMGDVLANLAMGTVGWQLPARRPGCCATTGAACRIGRPRARRWRCVRPRRPLRKGDPSRPSKPPSSSSARAAREDLENCTPLQAASQADGAQGSSRTLIGSRHLGCQAQGTTPCARVAFREIGEQDACRSSDRSLRHSATCRPA